LTTIFEAARRRTDTSAQANQSAPTQDQEGFNENGTALRLRGRWWALLGTY
jgi:hypothetical protein